MAAAREAKERLEPREGDAVLDVELLERTPMFAGLGESTQRKLRSLRGRGAVIARRFAAGDVIIRQGEPGWTAFYILRDLDVQRVGLEPAVLPKVADAGPEDLEASVNIAELITDLPDDAPVVAEVSIASGPAATSVPTARAKPGLVDLVLRRRRHPLTTAAAISAAPTNEERIAELRAGELFGEQSCFSHQPRTATVRAVRDGWMLEIMSNVLELALEQDQFRRALESVHRERMLRTRLSALPPLAGADSATLERVRGGATVETFDAGARVFSEGEPADAVYFVLRGHLRLEREGRVVRYCGRGDTIGIDAFLDERPRASSCFVHDPGAAARRAGRASARCEVLRIDLAALRRAAEDSPAVDTNLREAARDDLLRSADVEGTAAVENLAGALGLVAAEKLLLLDLEKCTQCEDCVRACASLHDGQAKLSLTGPQFGRFLVADSCRQCDDPTCLVGCPVAAIHRGISREIVIEPWCIACGLCAEQCAYDAIDVVEIAGRRRASTCDQCASLGDGTPMCVHACGPGAARRVDGRAFFAEGAEA